MNKLSLIGILKEESGEKGFARQILQSIVKSGEKVLPKEIGRYEINGARFVLKSEAYVTLMSKEFNTLTREELQIIRQVNTNIANSPMGYEIITSAIKNATKGLDRIGTKTVQGEILQYFDREVAENLNYGLSSGSKRSRLPVKLEQRIEQEISYIPEGGPIANPELPDITDITPTTTITFLKNRAEKNGLNTDNGLIEKVLETCNKAFESNKELASAINKQSDVIMSQAAEKMKSPTPNSGSGDVKPPKNVSPKLVRGLKKLFMSGKTYKEVQTANMWLTVIQMGSVIIDIMGTDKELKNFDQPITGLNLWEIAGLKLSLGVLDKITMGLGTGGKLLLAANYVLTAIDISAMAIDLTGYHPVRKEKEKQEKIRVQKEKEKKTQDSLRNEKLKQRGLDSLKNIELDSLKQKYSVDSLQKAVLDKLNPNKPKELDSTGKTPLPKNIF